MPLSLTGPAATTLLAYLNARWSFVYDVNLLTALLRSTLLRLRLTKNGRFNHFFALEEHALHSKTGQKPFIVYQTKSWTFHEVYQITLRYAAWLKQTHNVQSGDVVAMDFMNSPHFVLVFMALLSLGAKPALINYNLVKTSLEHCVRISTAKLLLVDGELREIFTPEQLAVFVAADFRDDGGPVEIAMIDEALDAQIMEVQPFRAPDSDRLVHDGNATGMLIYTSGTTGLPKAAHITWNKSTAGSAFSIYCCGLRKTDRVYTVCPILLAPSVLISNIYSLTSYSACHCITRPPAFLALYPVWLTVQASLSATDSQRADSGMRCERTMQRLFNTLEKLFDMF